MKAGDTIMLDGAQHSVRRVHTPAEMNERMPSMRHIFDAAAADGCTQVAIVQHTHSRRATVIVQTEHGWETLDGHRPTIVAADPPPR